jgi:hypothetical protein
MIWKNQRYQLINEYIESPILPPPLSLLLYVYNRLNILKERFFTDSVIIIEDTDISFRGI